MSFKYLDLIIAKRSSLKLITPWLIAFHLIFLIESWRIYMMGGQGVWMAIFANFSLLAIPLGLSSIAIILLLSLMQHSSLTKHIKALKHPWIALLVFLIMSSLYIWTLHTIFMYLHPQIKRAYYQGLAISLCATLLWYLILFCSSLLYITLSKMQRWCATQYSHRKLPNISFDLRWLLPLLSCFIIVMIYILSTRINAWKTLDFRPVYLAVVYISSIIWGYTLITSQHTKELHTKPFWSHWINKYIYLSAISILLLPMSLWMSMYHLSDAAILKISRDTTWTHYALQAARTLSDFDHDQRSSWFRGGDCDDRNPKVRSAAYEPIGKDWNCNQQLRNTKIDPWNQTSQAIWPALKADQIPQLKSAKHVVLLTIDALRYDTFRTHMPHLQKLAPDAIDFESAYSAGAATYWSVPTLIGSKYPSRFHMGRDQTPVQKEYMLAEALQAQGFHTSLFANVTIFFVRGLRQGHFINNYDTSHYTKHGAIPGAKDLSTRVIQHIGKWQAGKLQKKRDRFFIWAHYYDPHDPYFKVSDYPSDGNDFERYQSIVRSVDTQIVRVIKALKQKKLWQDTLLIITSDHGDEFFDHGHRFHGKTLYEEMVHVPLLVFMPHQKGIRVKANISHRDVVPTVLSQLGLHTSKKFTGYDWSQWLHARSLGRNELSPTPEKSVFFEVLPDRNYGKHLVGMRIQHYKMILDVNYTLYELYDLQKDPREINNIYMIHPQSKIWAEQLAQYANMQMNVLSKQHAGTRKLWGSPRAERKKR